MSNSWFQFKQFRVEQNKCAMKVGTDGVLLGAWTPIENARMVADLGSGTGLISLMIAQRSKARITGIESDMDAATQSAENFMRSPWPERLECVWADVHEMSNLWAGQFDLVICNPPFFQGHVRPSNAPRNQARHLLSPKTEIKKTWFEAAYKITQETGRAAFIFPYEFAHEWLSEAGSAGWHVQVRVNVRGHAGKEFKRVLVYLVKHPVEMLVEELCIESEERSVYTSAFGQLVDAFYIDAQIETI
jgi:tRNA1Val (adenine37-N6)-methyltransferase